MSNDQFGLNADVSNEGGCGGWAAYHAATTDEKCGATGEGKNKRKAAGG